MLLLASFLNTTMCVRSYKERKANLEVQHGFRMHGGTLTPLTWMAAVRDIPQGEVRSHPGCLITVHLFQSFSFLNCAVASIMQTLLNLSTF